MKYLYVVISVVLHHSSNSLMA